MRFVATLGVMAALLGGCAAARHDPPAYHAAGSPLPIRVEVDRDKGQVAAGSVHWRLGGQRDYQAMPLQSRGDELWAQLPVEPAQVGASVEYFIDVRRGGEFVPLANPAEPYSVRLVDPVHWSILNMRHHVDYGDALRPICFHLYTGDLRIDHAEVVYAAPDLPGEARAPMWGSGGHWILEISDRGVRSGAWNYHIVIHLNGKVYRLPMDRDATFYVSESPPPRLMRQKDKRR
jgi:hypothetical protein